VIPHHIIIEINRGDYYELKFNLLIIKILSFTTEMVGGLLQGIRQGVMETADREPKALFFIRK